jgi:hypothetical protein
MWVPVPGVSLVELGEVQHVGKVVYHQPHVVPASQDRIYTV